MPAKSKAQQALMAIAEHNPSAVSSKNKGVLEMTHTQLHDFAATKTKGLPQKVKKKVVTTKVKHTPIADNSGGGVMGKLPQALAAGPSAPPDQQSQINSLIGPQVQQLAAAKKVNKGLYG
jgi:hypothetical protein